MTNPRHPGSDDGPPPGLRAVPEEVAGPPNGIPPGLKKDPSALAAKAVAQALGEHLPQMMFQAFAAALSQTSVRTVTQPHFCGPCLVKRVQWEAAHEEEMHEAMEAAAIAAGVVPGSPQAAQVDFGPFLPEGLRPGAGENAIPQLTAAIVTIGGTDVCGNCVPVPGAQQGRKPFLIAHQSLSSALIADVMRQPAA